MRKFLFLIVACLLHESMHGQVSFSVSPSKLYFQVPPGESGETTLTVNNSGAEERTYSTSFMAWDRNTTGVKEFSPDTGQVYSCAKMLRASPAVFTLSPDEEQLVTVTLAHRPSQQLPALWAMLIVRELNPRPSEKGTQGVRTVLNIEYQIGVHVYQELSVEAEPLKLEVDTMYLSKKAGKKQVNIQVRNSSRLIGEVRLEVQFFSMDANQATSLPARSLTFLPDRRRTITIPLPDDLAPGDYTVTASLDPGKEHDLFVADFYFKVPPD